MADLPVVILTGASGGIGEQLAYLLAATKSYRLVVVARRQDVLETVAAKCRDISGGAAVAITGDVSVRADANNVVAKALETFGRVDVLINNVGRGVFTKASELTEEVIEDMMRVNVYSALFMVQALLPCFRANKSGHVVNVSSLLGRVAEIAPMRSAYSGAKHFLNGLTGSLRQELAPENVSFSLVSPGVVATEFGLNAGGPDSRKMSMPGTQEPEEVAKIILEEAVVKKKAEVYTSQFGAEKVVSYIQATAAISSS